MYSEQKQALAAELSFKHPAVLAVSGSAGSGKTALLAALLPVLKSRGLKVGVIREADDLRLPAETELTDAGLSDRELRELGCAPLPRNLQEALDLFENSPLMRDALGEHIHSFFLRKKRAEWEKYTSIVTEWEVQQYLASS